MGAVVAIVPEAVEVTGRRQAEEALRQAQKMETIGQLTGGIAHDFNNLLQVIAGNLYLFAAAGREAQLFGPGTANRTRHPGYTTRSNADPAIARILAAATSGSQGARHKPPGYRHVRIFCSASLGESIRIETVLAAGLWRSFADASELENALLNLAVNARDAMPQGGTLTIETANARIDDAYAASNEDVIPGEYVMIAVTDTGTGMTSEVIARAFEPFFTTKDAGHGTGLGLSQVYGFVKQSGGQRKIDSEPNTGTTVRIYMPRMVDEPTERINQAVRSPLMAGTREEIILVVEDDEDVRANTTTMLRDLATECWRRLIGPAALRIIEGRSDIDLLFTASDSQAGSTGANWRTRHDCKGLF